MNRTRWILLVVIVLIALFAVLAGGFLWPRPQFRRGPWAGPGPVPADSVGPPAEAKVPEQP